MKARQTPAPPRPPLTAHPRSPNRPLLIVSGTLLALWVIALVWIVLRAN